MGGFRSCEEWIALASERSIGWWVTSALESNIGLNAIAQWTFSLRVNSHQGLGTGKLFTNNFESPLEDRNGTLTFNSNQTTNFHNTVYFSSANVGLISWGSMGGGTGFGIRGESGRALSLGSNGAWDKLIIDTSGDATFAGDVTIGALTSGETAQLTVNNEGGVPSVARFKSRTNKAHIEISDNDTTGYISSENGLFSIGRNAGVNAAHININASNQVLIGASTTSFNDKLYVHGDGYTTGAWRVGTPATYVGKMFNSSGAVSYTHLTLPTSDLV